jgi:hypothetical protein
MRRVRHYSGQIICPACVGRDDAAPKPRARRLAIGQAIAFAFCKIPPKLDTAVRFGMIRC